MAGQSQEGLPYECKDRGRVWRTESDEQRLNCPSCHPDNLTEVEPAPEPQPGLLQRRFGRRSP